MKGMVQQNSRDPMIQWRNGFDAKDRHAAQYSMYVWIDGVRGSLSLDDRFYPTGAWW